MQTAIVDPLTWDVDLAGKSFTSPDGSVVVTAQATPGQGPGFTERYEDCPIPDEKQPGVTWQSVGGKPTGGVYDLRKDYPLPANATGELSTIIHIEETDRQ